MIQFKGFKPQAMQRIAGTLGYRGDMSGFNDYLNQNPDKKQQMGMYQQKAVQMLQGGLVKMQQGGQVLSLSNTPFSGTEIKGSGFADQDNFDDDGFIGDPRRMRQDLTFDKATGAYKSFGMSNTLGSIASDAPTGRPSLLSGVKQPIDFDPKADPRGVPVQNGPDLRDATQYLPKIDTNYERPPSFQGTPLDAVLPDSMKDFIAQGKRIDGRKMSNQELDNLEYFVGTNRGGGEFLSAKDKNGVPVILTTEQKQYLSSKNFTKGDQPLMSAGSSTLNPAADPRTPAQTSTPPQAPAYEGESITELQAKRALDPALPYGTTVQPVGTEITSDQIIDPSSGQVTGDITTPITTATTAQADMPEATDAAKVDAAKASDQVAKVASATTAAQGDVDPNAIVEAQKATSSSVSDLESAQGKAVLMDNPVQRKVEAGELVSSVSNAATAAKFTEEIQAAQATPTKQATVQGQLETLMQQFEGGKTPAWAAGAMRNATATMAARGLGASSMAGQAIVQAAMESAIPVAQADASVIASVEAQNLSNRQQRAMLAAEQRAAFIGQEFDQAFQARVINASKISDIANMNFTAEQQVALENSRAANTMNLANLGNRQALVMSEAAALANMDMANLNNRQQAAVMNAQSFLQMDMANLSNQQQTEMFKAQTQVQSLLTDQAAENAARQFNASSQNQTDQFFANLQTQASQFNTAQANAQSQFNAGESNVMNRFAAEMMNQRDQFNAQNRLVIDQNNAQWRRQVATADTAAINRANEINATNLLDISNTAYNNLWSYYQDSMEWAWNSAENERQRIVDLASIKLQVDAKADIASMEADYNSSAAWGGLMATMFTTPLGGDTLLGKGLSFLGL